MKSQFRISQLEIAFTFAAAFLLLCAFPLPVYAEVETDAFSQSKDTLQNGTSSLDMQEAGDSSETTGVKNEKGEVEKTVTEEGLDPVNEEENFEEEDEYICNGSLRLSFGEFYVSGDRGRFREDQWISDGSRGGIDWFNVEFFPEEECDYRVILEGRAIVNDWYEAYFLARRSDANRYLKAAFTGWRHYFDGTTKVATTKEVHDSKINLDRRTYLAEAGYTPEDKREFIIGWHRLENDGVEPPLRGVSAENFSGPYDLLGLLHEDGTTDTFYGELAYTFCDRYNLRFRTEYERYDDNQHGFFGISERFKEDNDIRIWRQYALFDSFLNDLTYISLSYMFYDVKNTTTRDVFRSSGAPRFFEKDVNNTKWAHIGLARVNRQRFLNVCHLTCDARLRVEYSDTSLKGDLVETTPFEKTRGSFDALCFEESAKLTYKGYYRTTLTAEVQLQQRFEDRKWLSERRETVIRKTDIDDLRQRYTLVAVRRFTPCIKGTLKGQYRHWISDYHEREDSTEDDYPGYFGDIRRNRGDVMAKIDFSINSCLFSTLYYQWRQDNYKTDLGGKTGKRKIHRVGGMFSWNTTDHFLLTATGIYEHYRLDTPTNPEQCETWKSRKRAFDFRGDNYTIHLDGIYTFNPNTSTHFGYRHTEALGSVDFAGNYSYDQIDVGIERNISCLGELALSYRFIHFNDQRKKHDDYEAHGAQISWQHAF